MEKSGIVMLEGVDLIFRNFEGKEDQYNREGARNFGVIIPDVAVAQAMIEDGWSIKTLRPRAEDLAEDPELVGAPWIKVTVSYKIRPPKIVMISSGGRTNLTEGTVEMLDYADIIRADLIISPSRWSMPSGAHGIKAYLQTMFITIQEDELELKYAQKIDGGE